MKIIRRFYLLVFTAGLLFFAGCRGGTGTGPAPVPPVPVPGASAPGEKNAAAHTRGRSLFVIERSNNANVVHYDARLNAAGELDAKEPVAAYWILLAEDGRRKKLNWLEKKKAYGVRVKPGPSPGVYIMTLAAAPWLPLTVRIANNAARAEAAINGRPAVLEKMFIQTRGRLLSPKVVSIELYGKDLRTGAACREKIAPK